MDSYCEISVVNIYWIFLLAADTFKKVGVSFLFFYFLMSETSK